MAEDLLVDADERHARLDQPAGRQQAGARQAPAVALADLRPARCDRSKASRVRLEVSMAKARCWTSSIVATAGDWTSARERVVELLEQRPAAVEADRRSSPASVSSRRQQRLADGQDRVVVVDLRLALEGRLAAREQRVVLLPEEAAVGPAAAPALLPSRDSTACRPPRAGRRGPARGTGRRRRCPAGRSARPGPEAGGRCSRS